MGPTSLDQEFRRRLEAGGQPSDPALISKILYPDARERMTGYYLDPSAPTTALPVDFEGGEIQPVFKYENGKWELYTMFVNPRPGRHS